MAKPIHLKITQEPSARIIEGIRDVLPGYSFPICLGHRGLLCDSPKTIFEDKVTCKNCLRIMKGLDV
jgi:hypothetical protein